MERTWNSFEKTSFKFLIILFFLTHWIRTPFVTPLFEGIVWALWFSQYLNTKHLIAISAFTIDIF